MDQDKLPIDARILGDAIIELNISRHNVAIYPEGHPSVSSSLTRAFEFLEKLFELRPEITLAIAQDTLIVDDHFLDKKNSVFREFAKHLSTLHMAHVTFTKGLTPDELLTFHRLLTTLGKKASKEEVMESIGKSPMHHIMVGFIDYGAFSFEEGRRDEREKGEKKIEREEEGSIWERYIYGLISGTLVTKGSDDIVQTVPPALLADFINKTDSEKFREDSYDRVITAYVRRSTERKFSAPDLKRLLDFIGALSPKLKGQFLSSTVKNVSQDIPSAQNAIEGLSVDEIIELLKVIDEQEIIVPEALKNLLDKFSTIDDLSWEDGTVGNSLVMDDILLSPDITNLLKEGDFSDFVTDEYQKEMKKLMSADVSYLGGEATKLIVSELQEEALERDQCRLILEVITTLPLTEEEFVGYMGTIREKTDWLVETGQWGTALHILDVIEKNPALASYSELTLPFLDYVRTEEFLSKCARAMGSTGRLNREDSLRLCRKAGNSIIPHLIRELSEEETQSVRRFLISIISDFKGEAVPYVVKFLDDSRWYVTRNMLLLLSSCAGTEAVPLAFPKCTHSHVKVRGEALRILLKYGDPEGKKILLKFLHSEMGENVALGMELAGKYKVKEALPLILKKLKKINITGKDIEDKVILIRILGEMGDPGAVPVLKEIITERSLLFKGALDRMREEIYRSLKFYPYPAVKILVEKGARSKNHVIQKECVTLMKKGKSG